MSEARNNTIPHIIITGGAEQLPKSPPIGGGIYRAEPAFPRESYAGWGEFRLLTYLGSLYHITP